MPIDAGADPDTPFERADDTRRTTWRWPREPGEEIRHHPRSGPFYGDYFPNVWLQIINLPDSTDRLLAQTMRGWIPENPSEARSALQNAGMDFALHERFVAATLPITQVALPMEGGCCDLVRARWKPRGADYVVDFTRARHVQSVRIRNWQNDPLRPLVDQVNEFASSLFEPRPKGVLRLAVEYRFIQINDADGTKAEDPAYGCHDTDWRTYGKHAPHYADYMHWWVRPGEIGFISSTHDGIVHQGFTPIDGERNVHWFGAASQPQQKGPPPDPSLAPALRAARRSGARVR